MRKNKLELFIDQHQLQDRLGELNDEDSYPIQGLFQYRYNDQTSSTINQTALNSHQQQQLVPLQREQNLDLIDLILMQNASKSEKFKRPRNATLLDEDVFTPSQSLSDEKFKSNQDVSDSQKTESKKQKQSKQYLYSKNYRDKKKQQFKILQEQNRFLKNKIQDLHERIRELQMQNNKLKEFPEEKDVTVQQLNKIFMQKLCILGESIQSNIEDKGGKQKSINQRTRADLEKQYLQRYNQVGLCGTQKKGVLNYHMDEIIQGLFRDSQKYFCMLSCKNQDGSFKVPMPKYERINMAFFQIMQLKESDYKRIDEYLKFLFPAMKQIKKQCSLMYRHFNKVVQALKRLHFLWTSTHVKNIDWVIKRMKIENWFEYHKYHRIMRELKSQWLTFIKNEDQMEDENVDYSKGNKRTKIYQTMNGQ